MYTRGEIFTLQGCGNCVLCARFILLRIYFNLESVRWAFINISFQTFNQKFSHDEKCMLMSLTWLAACAAAFLKNFIAVMMNDEFLSKPRKLCMYTFFSANTTFGRERQQNSRLWCLYSLGEWVTQQNLQTHCQVYKLLLRWNINF